MVLNFHQMDNSYLQSNLILHQQKRFLVHNNIFLVSKINKILIEMKLTLKILQPCFQNIFDQIMNTFSYCGFYNYIVVVHYCQPYCLDCIDEYHLHIKVLQNFHNQNVCEFRNFSCTPCSVVILVQNIYLLLINYTTCKSTQIKSQLGCFCKQNQYEEANLCLNCPKNANNIQIFDIFLIVLAMIIEYQWMDNFYVQLNIILFFLNQMFEF
ncbi:unnamed protein product [Paramecium sonneborni]|uniref:Uncharacterized protein n=1 Tax=Paramecium sonneborni TaxID=65129 RepID=A0A8S1QBN1_9CILI|nr:unnamed protein product [Paramecium sonneborni]